MPCIFVASRLANEWQIWHFYNCWVMSRFLRHPYTPLESNLWPWYHHTNSVLQGIYRRRNTCVRLLFCRANISSCNFKNMQTTSNQSNTTKYDFEFFVGYRLSIYTAYQIHTQCLLLNPKCKIAGSTLEYPHLQGTITGLHCASSIFQVMQTNPNLSIAFKWLKYIHSH